MLTCVDNGMFCIRRMVYTSEFDEVRPCRDNANYSHIYNCCMNKRRSSMKEEDLCFCWGKAVNRREEKIFSWKSSLKNYEASLIAHKKFSPPEDSQTPTQKPTKRFPSPERFTNLISSAQKPNNPKFPHASDKISQSQKIPAKPFHNILQDECSPPHQVFANSDQ